MPFIYEGDDWLVGEDISESIATEGYVILTRANEEDSCCLVVSCKWGNDYDPDDDWYDSQDISLLWDLYQGVDVQWAYRDSRVDSFNCGSRRATILLSR